MLIDFREFFKNYNVKCKGLIQVGAHWCEEHEVYVELGISDFVYIEPCRDAFKKMCEKFEVNIINDNEVDGTMVVTESAVLFNVACGEMDCESVMYVSHNNQGQSNSLLKPNLHLVQHKEVVFNDAELVKVKQLDNLPFDNKDYNFLVMDCQGFEGNILKGATETLKNIDYIYTEVNRDSTYENNMLIDEIDELLSDFKRMETYWPSPNWSWGDALYIRKSIL
jgi:FkbM family methyltransferase